MSRQREPAPAGDLVVAPGPDARSVRTPDGRVLRAPDDWALLPPGDAALTRRTKQSGPTWTVVEKRGRKTFGRGVWALAARIETIRAELAQERADPAYDRRLAQGRQRRAREQTAYVAEFEHEVLGFLAFAPAYADLAAAVARAIAEHATPVGSGTVARTQRIPVAERAEAATIAWLRHRTTTYDSMFVPRRRGMRREIRRRLAETSRRLLDRYRRGEAVDAASCPLRAAVHASSAAPPADPDASMRAP